MPKTRRAFWLTKLSRNVERDAIAKSALEQAGWLVEVIWECEAKDASTVRQRFQALTLGHSKEP